MLAKQVPSPPKRRVLAPPPQRGPAFYRAALHPVIGKPPPERMGTWEAQV